VTKIRVIFCQAKFGDRAVCPRCNSRLVVKTYSERWKCRNCWYNFGLRTGTFLAKKRVPLRLWYEIAYGFAIGLPAYRLQKILKVGDYRTIYGSYKVIRQALIQNSREEFKKLKFGGITEGVKN